MNRDLTIRIGTWVGTLIAGICLGWALNDILNPNCPTEDSCTVDYRDGEWHIKEVNP